MSDQVILADEAFSLQKYATRQPYRNQYDLNGFVDKLNVAGLPD